MIAFRMPKWRQWIINKEMTPELYVSEYKEKLVWDSGKGWEHPRKQPC